ncbi:MAG: hypothetical protein WD077_00235 [Bacteroidia bacterium]
MWPHTREKTKEKHSIISNTDYELNFYKELYYKEGERKSSLDSSVYMPLALILALSVSACLLLSYYDFTANLVLMLYFIFFYTVSAILLAISIYKVLVLYNNLHGGHAYRFLPFPSELHQYHEELISYYEGYQNGKEKANEEFQAYLKQRFIDTTDHNSMVNDDRALTLYGAKKYIILCFLMLSLAVGMHGINYFAKAENRPNISRIF